MAVISEIGRFGLIVRVLVVGDVHAGEHVRDAATDQPTPPLERGTPYTIHPENLTQSLHTKRQTI